MNDRIKILADEVKNLQEIIKRMASNSFEIKKWTVALIVVAVTFKSESYYQPLVGFIPLILFWYLNAYFLRQERLFRKKYEDLIKTRPMSDEGFFDVNPQKYEKEVDSICKIAFSVKSIVWFYGSLSFLLALILIFRFVFDMDF